jgi:preprotein translocase subunit Sss1
MRHAVHKLLSKRLEDRIGRTMAGWSRMVKLVLPPQWEVYRNDTSCDQFLEICVSPSRDEFTLELAWSENGIFPGELLPMQPLAGGGSDFRRTGRLRVGFFWTGRDYWWKLYTEKTRPELEAEDDTFLTTGFMPPEPSLEDVKPLIAKHAADAVAKFTEFALPYLKTVCRNSAT